MALLLAGSSALAATGDQSEPHPTVPDDTESSLFALVEDVARTIEKRAASEKAEGPIHLTITAARGVDARKVDRAFAPRLRRRLRNGGVVIPATKADLRARVVLSLEGARLWAVGQLEGGTLIGPITFALKRTLDRELEAFFGIAQRAGATGFVLQRLGPVAAGALDLCLVDVDQDGTQEIAILGVDGVRVYRFGGADARPRQVGAVKPLVGDNIVWPRLVAGWMAPKNSSEVFVATSAGHALTLNLKRGEASFGTAFHIPLAQAADGDGPRVFFLKGGRGTPSLAARFYLDREDGRPKPLRALPPLVRDLVQVPGSSENFLWVDEEGRLGGRTKTKSVSFSTMERVGDRISLGDFDADGEFEVVTTSAAGPGEPDRLRVLALTPDFANARLLFQHGLSGGSIVAQGTGDFDLDDRADVFLVEESAQGEALLWRLEYQP